MHQMLGPHDLTRHTLPNGITVLARENMNSPSVVVDASIHAGSIYEGRTHAGMATCVLFGAVLSGILGTVNLP